MKFNGDIYFPFYRILQIYDLPVNIMLFFNV